MKPGRSWLGASVAAAVVALAATFSWAQEVLPGRGLTVVVGAPAGPAVMERLDVERTGVSRTALPASSLRIIWTRQLRPARHPPLVLPDGSVVVVTDQGDATLLNADGTDHGHVSMGPGPMSAPVLLADETVVALNAAGEAVGVRRATLAFRTPIAEVAPTQDEDESRTAHRYPTLPHRPPRGRPYPSGMVEREPKTRAWLLPLDDGGAALAFGRTLASIDGRGAVRSRTTSSAAIASPLILTGQGVAFVADGGEVYTWNLRSAADGVRARGSFGGSVEDAVAALGDRQLLGIVDGSRLVVLDLVTRESRARWHAPRGTLTGAFALQPSGIAVIEEMTPTGTRAVMVDHEGLETPFGPALTPQGALASSDAGAFLAPRHTQLFADPSGAVAFATVDGHVGVATLTGKVELGSLPCGAPPAVAAGVRSSAGFAGLVPAGPGAFVVSCEAGSVALVRGTPE